jgi:hypothetical protein
VKKDKRTTYPGYLNRNRQKVIRKTDLRGNDFGQFVYELECGKCSQRYGANGSDIWQRKCPMCQGGAAGFDLRKPK